MDIVTTAVLSAITSGLNNLATDAAKDAYKAVKRAIKQKLGIAKTIDALEADPSSQKQQTKLAEELAAGNAAGDSDLMALAQQLLNAIKEAGAGRNTSGKYNIRTSEACIGVIGDNARIEGGLHIHNYGGSKAQTQQPTDWQTTQPTTEKATTGPPLKIPEAYVEWIRLHCQYMDVDHLQVEGQVVRAELPEIFIPLFTLGFDRSSSRPINQGVIKDKDNIQELIGKLPNILIEGEAGSGKTTLLKHTALCLAEGRFEDLKAPNIASWLPVLIFLKDLEGMFESVEYTSSSITVESVLEYFSDQIRNVLPVNIIKRFIRARRVIFLLDGLDEMEPDHREQIVNAFALFKCNDKKNKIVLSSRPHGVVGATQNKFGQNHAQILPLDRKQVEQFIQLWFQYLYIANKQLGRDIARAMISEIQVHQTIEKLITTPLLLTATCIHYYGGKTLPGQRAELYANIINNLLCRRFQEPLRVLNFLSTLAFNMSQEQLRDVDEAEAIKALSQAYQKESNENDTEDRQHLKDLLKTVESGCGLLQRVKGGFSFRHLTFQEFLVALYIVNNSTDYSMAISDYWNNPRFEEVIEIYVGYLSINNKRWANRIVKEVLDQDDCNSFFRWRLAAKALLDIQPDRRDPNVRNLAEKKLRVIIDTGAPPKDLVDAGETLGCLGDRRNLQHFVQIPRGNYSLKKGIVLIDSFEISQYLIINQWYAKFINASGYQNDAYWDERGWKWLQESKISYPRYWYSWNNCPNAPVIGVNWFEASAFCRWLTEQEQKGYIYNLPTANQWEAVAAGMKQREYPWGEWQDGFCNTQETEINKPSPVGIFKKGDSPENVSDLAGNVWEWTSSKRDVEGNEYLLRGGSWFSDFKLARCTIRVRNNVYGRLRYFGFRCVRTK